MIVRIVLIGALALLAMFAVKNGTLLRQTGLLGSCVVSATGPGGAQQEKCTAGTLDGRPDLSGRGCRSGGISGRVEYWNCPAPLQSSPGGGV